MCLWIAMDTDGLSVFAQYGNHDRSHLKNSTCQAIRYGQGLKRPSAGQTRVTYQMRQGGLRASVQHPRHPLLFAYLLPGLYAVFGSSLAQRKG